MQCTICFRNIDVYAVLPCNHNICCSECIFKEIALFGNRKCPYCKVGMRRRVRRKALVKTPIFTVIPKKTYSELQGEYRFKHNKEYDIDFDNEIVEKWHLDLLIMRCTICDPYVPYSKINERSYTRHEIEDYGTVGSLQDHLRAEHGRTICSLCANKGRLFPYELKLYARQVGSFSDDDSGDSGAYERCAQGPVAAHPRGKRVSTIACSRALYVTRSSTMRGKC